MICTRNRVHLKSTGTSRSKYSWLIREHAFLQSTQASSLTNKNLIYASTTISWLHLLKKVFLDNGSARICKLESFGSLHHHLHLASWRRMLVGRKVRNSTNNYCTTWSSEVHPCISNPRQRCSCHYWPASAHPHLTKIKITRKQFDVDNEHSEIIFLSIVTSCNMLQKRKEKDNACPCLPTLAWIVGWGLDTHLFDLSPHQHYLRWKCSQLHYSVQFSFSRRFDPKIAIRCPESMRRDPLEMN